MLQHENPEVLKLLQFMDKIGFEFAVLGGYPRDLHFNTIPRDMDVCCFNNKTDTVLWRDRFIKLLSYLQDQGMYLSEFATDDNDYPSDRIYGGISTTCKVDIIFWKDNFTSPEEILAMFDFNINQFTLVRDWDTGATKSEPWLGMKDYGTLVQLRESEVTDARLVKIQNMANRVGWEIPLNGIFTGSYDPSRTGEMNERQESKVAS